MAISFRMISFQVIVVAMCLACAGIEGPSSAPTPENKIVDARHELLDVLGVQPGQGVEDQLTTLGVVPRI
ncbi:MAG: hypothetical protein HN348_12500 [Proteobacteria bacterium]|nr:hypothetical protein [Pseudomonadota bacterium]